MSLYLFRRESRGAAPACWEEIEAVYDQVEELFDHLQTIYRPMTISPVRSTLDELIGHHVPKWRSWLESRGKGLQLDPPMSEVPGDFDPAHLGVGIDAMAAWRAEVSPPGIVTRVGWGLRDGVVEIRWREVPLEHVPDPPEHAGGTQRRDASQPDRGVDALAIPLLARILASHDGCLELERGPGFGVSLRWPQYQRVRHDGVA